MTTKRFMPDWKDGDRTWVDLGGDIEASYDGERYVHIRIKPTHEGLCYITKEALEKALALFDPPPVCE